MSHGDPNCLGRVDQIVWVVYTKLFGSWRPKFFDPKFWIGHAYTQNFWVVATQNVWVVATQIFWVVLTQIF